MGAHGTNGQKLFKFNCYSKLDKLKLTAFPYLSPRTLGEGLKKKKKRMKPNLLKNIVLWTSKINLSYIPHIHVVNHYYPFNQMILT